MTHSDLSAAVPAPDNSASTNRIVFLIRYVVPVVGVVLAALLVYGVVTSPAVRLIAGLVVAAAAVLALYGFTMHRSASRRDAVEFAPTGTMADAGGFRLHMRVTGEANGRPTVVLDGGLVSLADNWHWVQTALAKETRVVAFDRAGFGGSEISPHPRDVQQIAREMYTALHNAGIDGPYVLAGHSFGGLTVRAFADLYPEEVAGLVLVDASHPDQWLHMPVPNADRMLARSLQMTSLLSHVGLGRVMTGPARAVAAGLPEPLQRAIIAACAPAHVPATEAKEMRAWSTASRDQINRAKPLGDLPLAVISVSEQDLYGDALTVLQDQLAALSSNVRRTTVQGATHYSLLGERHNAEQVAQAISWAVASRR